MPFPALFSESRTSSPKPIRRFAFRALYLGILIAGLCGPGSLDAEAQPDWLLQNEPVVASTPEPTPEPNIPPSVKSWTFETPVNTAVSIPLDASDANEDRLTYKIVDKPRNGVISGIAPDLIYTPEANYTGIDSFTFKVNDGEFDSAIGTVTIEILPADTNTSQGVDAQISVLNEGRFIGDGIYNRNGRGQTLEREFKANSSSSYEVRLQNEAGKAQSLTVKATPVQYGWSLRYFDAPIGGQDITSQITSKSGWQTPRVDSNGSVAIRVEIMPTPGAAENQDVIITLTDEAGTGGDVVKVKGYCPQPYCPDATIEITQNPVWESYDLGDDIYLPDGDTPNFPRYNAYFEAQTNRQFVGSGVTATYYVYAQNDGRVTDQLRIKAPAGSDGWSVRYFNECGNNEDITAAITGAGWTTPDLKPGEEWGIRVEVTPGDNKFGTSFPVAVQVDSVGAGFYPDIRDVVTADTVCEHLTNDLVIYPIEDDGKAAMEFVGNRIINTDAKRQIVTLNSFVLNPTSVMIASQVSHIGALYRYTAPAGDGNWSLRYFYGAKDITEQITGAGWEHKATDKVVLWATKSIFPVSISDPIRVEITPLTTAAASVDKELMIQSAAVHETEAVDTVKVIVHREPTLDVSIRPSYELDYEGVGVFNTDARNQTVGFSQVKGKGIEPVFDIRIANHSSVTDTYVVKAPPRSEGWTLHFYDASVNGRSITAEITSTKGWTTPKLAPGETFRIRLETTPDSGGQGISIGGSLVTVTSVLDKTAADAVKATFGSQVIKKMQYSVDQGTTWIDAPAADSGEYVPGLAKTVIGFRAIPVDPSLPWPIVPSYKPLWDDGGYWNMGEDVWIGCGAAGQERLITAECGNIVKTRMRVYEWYTLSSVHGSKTYVALNGGKEGQLTLTTKVTKSDGKPAAGMTLRFTAKFENGETAGQIGEGNPDDALAVTDANGNASVTLFTDNKEGYVDLQAFLVERGSDTVASRKGACVFGLPTSELAEAADGF